MYATQFELMTDTVSPTTPRKQEPSFIKEDKPTTLSVPKPSYSEHNSDHEVDFSDSDAEEDKLDDLLLLASDDEEDKEVPKQQQQSKEEEEPEEEKPVSKESVEEEIEKEKRARLYSSVGAMSMDNFRYNAPSTTTTTAAPSISITQVSVVEDVKPHQEEEKPKESKIAEAWSDEDDDVEVGESLMEQSNDVGEVLRYLP